MRAPSDAFYPATCLNNVEANTTMLNTGAYLNASERMPIYIFIESDIGKRYVSVL